MEIEAEPLPERALQDAAACLHAPALRAAEPAVSGTLGGWRVFGSEGPVSAFLRDLGRVCVCADGWIRLTSGKYCRLCCRYGLNILKEFKCGFIKIKICIKKCGYDSGERSVKPDLVFKKSPLNGKTH